MIFCAIASRFVMVQAQAFEKSLSLMVLTVGSWWEALQNRYIFQFHLLAFSNIMLTVEHDTACPDNSV